LLRRDLVPWTVTEFLNPTGCFGVVVDPGEGDDMQGPVELAVAASVEAVPLLLPA
jgi:hypothetical protein